VIVAIMQPYFFPYIGYFQLMQAVDTFVFFDDVQYIDRGWVNRNKIRSGKTSTWLTMPVHRKHRDLAINQRDYVLDPEVIGRTINRIKACYLRAPAYASSEGIIDSLLHFGSSNVSEFNCNALTRLSAELGIKVEFVLSSNIKKSPNLKAEGKIIDICRRIGATHYVNPAGGMKLYARENFTDAGIRLSFLHTRIEPEPLDPKPEHLSIIDSLMHHDVTGVAAMLPSFNLVD
jgi:hypothetical protein